LNSTIGGVNWRVRWVGNGSSDTTTAIMTHDNDVLHSEGGDSVCKTSLTGEWVYS